MIWSTVPSGSVMSKSLSDYPTESSRLPVPRHDHDTGSNSTAPHTLTTCLWLSHGVIHTISSSPFYAFMLPAVKKQCFMINTVPSSTLRQMFGHFPLDRQPLSSFQQASGRFWWGLFSPLWDDSCSVCSNNYFKSGMSVYVLEI